MIKAKIANATGVLALSDVKIDNISYAVTVTYTFSRNISMGILKKSIAQAMRITVDQVSLAYKPVTRRSTGASLRRLAPSTVQAVITTDNATAAAKLYTAANNTSAVEQTLQAEGQTVTAQVTEAPRQSITIQAAVTSKDATPVTPDKTKLGAALGGTVEVTDVEIIAQTSAPTTAATAAPSTAAPGSNASLTPSASSAEESSSGAIIGGIVGGVVGLILVFGCCYCICKCKKKSDA